MIAKLKCATWILTATLPVACVSSVLPEGYFAVDYIEATGTQYIDTGVSAAWKRCAKGVFSFPVFPAENEWYGILSASDVATNDSGEEEPYCFAVLGVAYADSTHAQLVIPDFSSPLGLGAKYYLDSSEDRYYCAGSYYSNRYRAYFCTNITEGVGNVATSNKSNTRSLEKRTFYLFANNDRGEATNFAKARLYSLSVNQIGQRYFLDEGTPLRNYVPAYRIVDSTYGLYDTVADEFKESEGSEPFLGPAVMDIGEFDETSYVCEFIGCSPGVSSPEIGMKIVVSRRSDAIRRCGVVANGVTNLLDEGEFVYEVTSENVNSPLKLTPFFDNNWYVCNATGNDDNPGFRKSAPKRTLAAILAVATNAGDVVHAAAGVYASGEIVYDPAVYSIKYGDESFGSDPVRCEIASGVRLVGDAGASETVLDGGGTHRGVLLNPGAVIQGFTIQNCKASYYGSAVYGVNDSDVMADCILRENQSLRYTVFKVKAVFRSRFYANTAESLGAIGSKIYLYNCLIGEGNKGDYCFYNGCSLDNCTILGKIPASRKSVYFRNCLVVPVGREDSDSCRWWSSSYVGDQNSVDIFDEGCEQVSDGYMQFADVVDGVPVIGFNCGVDRGDEALYRGNYPSRLDPLPGGVDCDLFGSPRVSNGKMDRGCVESDWRGIYAEKIGNFFTVKAAASNVVSDLSSDAVRLYPGSRLDGVLRPGGRKTFLFTLSGSGVLTVNANGSVHEFSGEGGKSLFVAEGEVSFSYDGTDGFADILRSQGGGLLITIK